VERLGQAEVEDLGPAFGRDHDVGALEIAMDDAPRVGACEAIGELKTDSRNLSGCHGTRGKAGGERGAPDQLHVDEERGSV
jgi:hypothetical protein